MSVRHDILIGCLMSSLCPFSLETNVVQVFKMNPMTKTKNLFLKKLLKKHNMSLNPEALNIKTDVLNCGFPQLMTIERYAGGESHPPHPKKNI